MQPNCCMGLHRSTPPVHHQESTKKTAKQQQSAVTRAPDSDSLLNSLLWISAASRGCYFHCLACGRGSGSGKPFSSLRWIICQIIHWIYNIGRYWLLAIGGSLLGSAGTLGWHWMVLGGAGWYSWCWVVPHNCESHSNSDSMFMICLLWRHAYRGIYANHHTDSDIARWGMIINALELSHTHMGT